MVPGRRRVHRAGDLAGLPRLRRRLLHPEGFLDSGGQIHVASPQDVADASSVIDWTLANTSADPNRIGFAGVSYGAGLSLLAAAHDPRIKAVAAMSAWTDLTYSLYGSQTRHLLAADLLGFLGQLTGRPDAQLNQALSDLSSNTDIPWVESWAAVRSPDSYLSQLDANHPAVYIANSFGDSFFAPDQVVSFFNQYTGPKRLDLAPGDHATVELTGLAGLPNTVWSNVADWFGTYLGGGSTATTGVNLTSVGGSQQHYADWASTSTGTDTVNLSPTSISSGYYTIANAGVPFLTNGLTQVTGTPASIWLPLVDRWDAAVWQGPTLSSGAAIRGIPHAQLTMTPSASSGTLVAYLYDVNWLGNATFVTHAPYTYLDATPGAPLHISLDLNAIAYDVPAGDHLALVVGTKDLLYADADQTGSTDAFNGGTLTVPVG
ncbi:alpha/beta hydrolase fold domain-containing protein [Streptacidiphilus sp. PB12-B1b]|nr:CocE/NonD family hydrolase [Streptacidiphilus sp. PB12-B1b]QMU75815.1 alpha/beta hydrolase fold domain-containing protein [Streptacidiphilus sp. PB12-B1b]